MAGYGLLLKGCGHAGPTTPTGPQVFAANGLIMPFLTTNSTSTNLRLYAKHRRIPQNSNFSRGLTFHYANRATTTGGGYSLSTDYGMRNVVYNYRTKQAVRGVAEGGGDVATVAMNGWGRLYVDMDFQKGDRILEVMELVAPSGSRVYLTSHGSVAGLNEGVMNYASLSKDLLADFGTEADVTCVLSGNSVGARTVVDGGSKYTLDGTVSPTYPSMNFKPAEADINAISATGTLWVPAANGPVTSTILNNSGSGFNTAPIIMPAGGKYSVASTAIYAASVVSGVPDDADAESYVAAGDSRVTGWSGSNDAIGDFDGNTGELERALAPIAGLMKLSHPGITAQAWGLTFNDVVAYLISQNIRASKGVVMLGINDITAGQTLSNVMDYIAARRNKLRELGAEVSVATVYTSAASTDGYTTLANQTPRTGCGAGGVLDQLNAAIRAGSDARVVGDLPHLEVAALVNDATEPQKYRVDRIMTGDGWHINGNTIANTVTGNTYNVPRADSPTDFVARNLDISAFAL